MTPHLRRSIADVRDINTTALRLETIRRVFPLL
jgi:hypothetical protein